MLDRIKAYMMPIAMTLGILFHNYLSVLGFLTPYLLTMMLFISYCKISLKEINITKLHILLLSIQIFGSFFIYQLLSFIDPVLAQGGMICVLAPTATSAIVITGMLGGSMVSLASYSLLSNLAVAVFAPVMFVLMGQGSEVSFFHSVWVICQKVFLILLLPFFLTLILKKVWPVAFNIIRKKQAVSFYLWSITLTIVTAKIVRFIRDQEAANYKVEIAIAAVALIVCVLQFFAGRRLGRRYDDTVAGGQGLGQKNTILAIWMAQTYFNPISSIGPGTYVLWQNIVNSYQVWKKRRNGSLGQN